MTPQPAQANPKKTQRTLPVPAAVKRSLLLTLLGASLISLILFLTGEPDVEGEKYSGAAMALASPVILEPGPFQIEAEQSLTVKSRTARVQSGDTLARVLEKVGLNRTEAHQASQAALEVMDLSRIRPGGEVTCWRGPDRKPVRLEYKQGVGPSLVMRQTWNGWAATWRDVPPIRIQAAAQGQIQNSLWESAVKKKGLDPSLVMAFADVFAYEVDFLTEIQPGDSFRILYEQDYVLGQPVGHGRILAAEFAAKGLRLEAFLHEDREGEVRYYDATGRSLKKMFLKSPLQYSRITSYFTMARPHPILRIVTPHEGVDYAAPMGTPIDALGDGTITFLGWNAGYGNFIEIQHNKMYTTTYGHLSGFAPELKKGSRVKQGQLIGFVGSTGLSTGPHLDFRVKENNHFIDPLSVKLQPAPPIDAKEKSAFLAMVARRQAEMNELIAARQAD